MRFSEEEARLDEDFQRKKDKVSLLTKNTPPERRRIKCAWPCCDYDKALASPHTHTHTHRTRRVATHFTKERFHESAPEVAKSQNKARFQSVQKAHVSAAQVGRSLAKADTLWTVGCCRAAPSFMISARKERERFFEFFFSSFSKSGGERSWSS